MVEELVERNNPEDGKEAGTRVARQYAPDAEGTEALSKLIDGEEQERSVPSIVAEDPRYLARSCPPYHQRDNGNGEDTQRDVSPAMKTRPGTRRNIDKSRHGLHLQEREAESWAAEERQLPSAAKGPADQKPGKRIRAERSTTKSLRARKVRNVARDQ